MVRISIGSKLALEDGSWQQAIVDTCIGVLTGAIRALYLVVSWGYVNLLRPAAQLVGMELPSGKRPKIQGGGEIKVLAAGFGRTGTYSLMLALEELGFPTLHTIHLYAFENEEILSMLTDNVVNPSLQKKKPELGKIDFQLIADSGYQAMSDLPFALYFEQVLETFPDCKFILTTRESSERWFTSWTTLTKSVTSSMYLGGLVFPTLKQYSNYLRWVYSYVNQDSSYMTTLLPKDENIKENAIASYETHNRRVRELVPAEQLLEYSVKEGWGPLCDFLEIDQCPTTKFPSSNSGRSMRAQANSAFWVGCIVVFYLLFRVVRSASSGSRKQKTE